MTMRQATHIAALVLALCLGLCGCSDLMETSPSVEVDRSLILKDAAGMEVAMNGIYSTMYRRLDFVSANAHQCFGNMAVTLAAELMGEDMVEIAEGPGWFWKDYTYEMRQRYTSKIWRSFFTWSYFYEIINNANNIIAAAPTAAGNESDKEDILAQALTARAFSYFMLVQSFQQTYVGHEDLPGVPVYTEPTTSASEGKGRGTVEETYSRINEDLALALDLFKRSSRPRKDVSHLDYYCAALLNARVALVQNDWEAAAQWSTEAMAKPGCSLLSRAEATVTKGTFNDQDRSWTTGSTPFNSVQSSSVMWGVKVLPDQSTVYASFFSHMDASTNVFYGAESPKCISNWLYEQIPGTDIRKGWWNGDIGIDESAWSYGSNINYCQHKFQWADQNAHTGDYIFMRLEEAYLIRAEALCRLKRFDESRAVLGEIVSRRNPQGMKALDFLTGDEQTFASTGSVQTLLDEILLQRRIELWGEAGRIYDILRLGKGWTRYWEFGGKKTNHTNYLSKYSEYLAFPKDFKECIMMIPQVEIDNNPNIGGEDQNPYDK